MLSVNRDTSAISDSSADPEWLSVCIRSFRNTTYLKAVKSLKMRLNKQEILAVCYALFSGAFTFLLDVHTNTCIAPPPCVCDATSITCDDSALHYFPNFTVADYFRSSFLRISMAKNNFLQIPANAFENIDTTNATHITLVLSQNGISTIDDNAFNGIETEITELDLTNNDLTSLPIALGKLPNLAALWLSKNPLRSLTSQALFRVSLSVRELSLSLNNFSRWPRELHYFRFLHKLFVDGFTESRLPLDALSGLEKTITWFQVSESKLDLIPSVICHLPNLRYLDFISNWETQSPIFEPCNHNITEVHFLNLRNNTLKDFPDVLNSFTSLAILDVSVNNIRVIDSSLIPQNVSVTHLNLSHNAFTRVPSAITKFPYVTSLYLDNNMITSLEDPDLGHLANLRVLDLSHNPIEYISGDAFAWQTTFDYLDLSSTRLVLIPSALASPRSIVTLDLSRSPIECTCKLAYMKKWSVNVTTISGTCEGTGELVNSFVTSFLPLCP